jgi:glutathione S-transferase
MLLLYHTDMAVCAAKVRITLAEKKLQWTGRHIDLAAGEQFNSEYLALNPNAVVPTLVHGGRVVRDSTVISEYLDEVFHDIPLRPSSPHERASMRYWTKREDEIHEVVNTFMTAIAFRAAERQKSEMARRERIAKISDPIRRERWESLTKDGLHSSFAAAAFNKLARFLAEMETALQDSPWLGTRQFSLSDIGYIPYFNALSMLQLEPLWNDRFPAVAEWLALAKSRPSFATGVLDWLAASRVEGLKSAGLGERENARAQFDRAMALRT